jgi:hypothetical protein
MAEKRVIEGYLYILPYAGDGLVLSQEKLEKPVLPDPRRNYQKYREDSRKLHELMFEGRSIGHLLQDLEGKRIRITVEVLEERGEQ